MTKLVNWLTTMKWHYHACSYAPRGLKFEIIESFTNLCSVIIHFFISCRHIVILNLPGLPQMFLEEGENLIERRIDRLGLVVQHIVRYSG